MNTLSEILDQYQAGERDLPTYAELRALCPTHYCSECATERGGTHCWKCGAETFLPARVNAQKLPPIDRIRELAKEVGYAIGVHGSQQRDLDVIAAPWSDDAVNNQALLEHIAQGLVTENGPARIIEIERKPLGRYAATIQMDGWYKDIDISVCPKTDFTAIEMLKRIVEAEFEYGEWPSRDEIDAIINYENRK